MSRYFFHVVNGKVYIDDVGVDLPNMDEVRTEAIRSAGQMLSKGEQAWKGDAWQMIVADDTGIVVFGVSFATDRHGR